MSEEDLRYGILDLYKKVNLQLGILMQLLPSTLALVATLKEIDQHFEKVYARNFEAVANSSTVQGIEASRSSLDQAVRTLEKNWGL